MTRHRLNRRVSRACLAAALLAATATEAVAEVSSTNAASSSALDPRELTYSFIDKAIADGRFKAAVELIRRASTRFGGPDLNLRQAELLLASGALPEAKAAFGLLEADPVVGPRAAVGRAIALLKEGKIAEADALLVAALDRQPGMVRALSARGVLADKRRDWATAEAQYALAIKADPGSAFVYNNRGYSRLLQGRNAEAEGDFARAVDLAPDLAAARTNLSLARGLQGRYAEAFTASSRDDLARELNTVGMAALLRGDHRLAESYFSRAIEMNSRYDRTATANLAYLKAIAPEAAARTAAGPAGHP